MGYIYNNFLRPLGTGDKYIQILDATNVVKYTINPFYITNTQVVNNVVRINLRNDKVIILDFNNDVESKTAIQELQNQIDILTQKVPNSIDKNIENWVLDKLGLTGGGESIINTYHGNSTTPLQLPSEGEVINLTTDTELRFFPRQNLLVVADAFTAGFVWEYIDDDYFSENIPGYFIGTVDYYNSSTGQLALVVTKSSGFGLTDSNDQVPTFSTWQISLTGKEIGSRIDPYGQELFIDGHLLPGTTSVYNLGSPEFEWHTLYVGSQSLVIGGVTISSSNDSIIINSINLGTEQEPLILSAIGTSLFINDVEATGGSASVIEVAYNELTSIIGSASLTVGNYYMITDFKTCYDQPDFNINGSALTASCYRESDVHPLMVLAISNSELAVDAYQPDYPKDKIKYDYTWNQTEVSGGTAYGRITERIDEFNNRTDYDHRNVRFKRYRTRLLGGPVSGKIISMTDGLVIGTNSNFTGDFASGSVVFIESLNPTLYPTFYKVTNIVSATQMTVEGINYDNFNDSIGYSYQQTYLEQYFLPGSLYYFNDSGDDVINDGGDDMYDTGNRLNTNLYNEIPYTHTQMDGIGGQAALEDFTYDGTVENGDSYFGTASTYFTNTYPGLFVMAAYDVDVESFSITGELGADSDGDIEVDRYTWEGFTIFVKKVYNAGVPSVNHIIIVNSTDELIERTYDDTCEDDDHEITNLGNVTQIHYLLFGLSSGSKPTDTQIENVYQSYLNMIDSLDINVTLSTLNSDFTDITDNLPFNSTFVSLEHRRTNITDDNLVFREILTFDTVLGVDARNNYIGNACDSWQWDERDFMLPNNVFTNAFDNPVDIYDNHFGDRFVDNTFGDDVYENFVGPDFYNNMCQDRFDRNQIAANFKGNRFYNLEFERNSIGNNFSNNIFINANGDEFYDNQIGNDFTDNRFFSGSLLLENQIGRNFNSNRIHNQLIRNQIGNDFENNDIYRQFTNNTIRNGFNNNDIYDDFRDNFIDNGFENNTIGSADSIGNYDFQGNKIGYDSKGNFFRGYVYNNILGYGFYSNDVHDGFNGNVFGVVCIYNTFGTYSENNNIGNFFVYNDIGEYFSDNHIQNYFQNNDISYNFSKNHIQNYFEENNISYNFSFNEIGNRFSFNNIENDFGFGGAQSRGNKIGNYFQYNTIGEYFYDNTIVDLFDNNEVGNDFQMNDVKVQNLYNYNFIQYQGNIVTFTYQSSGTTSTPGFYNTLSGTTNGSGESASFGITVSGGTISTVSLVSAGNQYLAGDTIIISGTQIGGVSRAIATFSINSLSVKIYKPADATYQYPSDETEMDYLIDNSPLFDTYYSSNIQGVSYTTETGIGQSDYGMVIEGYIKIPSNGTYSFGLSSDDGSDAFINGVKVADWYGAHGDNGNVPSGNQYPISLTAGTYPIKVRLQERSGGDIVILLYSLDEVSWNIIPDNWFLFLPNATGITGSYTGIFATGGDGEGATFDVEVIGGLVDSVVLSNGGGSYLVGDVLTIPGSEFGGTQGITINVDSVYSDDVTITVTAVSATPSVYEYYNTTIFMNGGGNIRLSYYDENDVLTIKNITE